ncbi:MAG: DUF4115 domain-containing protein [Brachymonas denitrificans]|uniref:helix-turn-helix domain-containing protein n=1 Tax=Brachymonas denitrificans TaxID=28220 RepID=UPI001BCF9258|nr:helix-turn-helix domain-containing protein [Brachymonas denitrificans]
MNQAVKASYQFDSSQTAGQMLRGLREHAGVELEVLAAAMKVPPQKIEALEQDNLVSLPAYFARGLSANICRYLDADPHPVLAKLPDDKPRIATDDESINAPFSPHRFGSGMRSGGIPPWAIVGAGVLAAGALVLFLYPTLSSKLGSARAAASAASAAPAADAASAAPAQGSLTNLQASPAAAPSNLQPAPLTLQPAPAASAPDAAASAVAAAPAPAGEGLTLRAVGETWVQVRSAAGKTVYERTLKAGESDQVAIAAYPVRVTIGRAENVQLTDRGQPFDMASVASIGVARFELK